MTLNHRTSSHTVLHQEGTSEKKEKESMNDAERMKKENGRKRTKTLLIYHQNPDDASRISRIQDHVHSGLDTRSHILNSCVF
jgi:hypothetical protein